MSFRHVLSVTLLAAAVASCSKSSTSPSTSVGAPTPASPANNAVVTSTSQPITLSVTNASVGGSSVSYTFEVASDSGFTTLSASVTAAQSSGGTTSVTLPVLTSGRDYFWRVKTTSGSTTSGYSAIFRFSVGSSVTLTTPTAVSPASGATAGQRPTLSVTNSTATGPAGSISYRFDISTSSAFTTITTSGTVAQNNSGTTSFTPSVNLAVETTYFWRAQAVDQSSGATSAFSTSRSFSTIVSVDLSTVNFQRFPNVANWAETNRILSVYQDGGGDGPMCIDHAKRGQWPQVPFLGDPDNPIEGNQWYLARINGQWYAGAGEWLRVGQICKSGQKTNEIGPDGTWGGPMNGWVPKRGELVGYMITTPARAYPDMRTTDERSNVLLQPWQIDGISTP